MIRILKASAGSGKTYNLAREYIRLLLVRTDPQAYRHILAVTFTNKATEEMKGRILKELYILSCEPQKSPYYKDFVPAVLPSEAALRKRASDQLSAILHDSSSRRSVPFPARSVSSRPIRWNWTRKGWSTKAWTVSWIP